MGNHIHPARVRAGIIRAYGKTSLTCARVSATALLSAFGILTPAWAQVATNCPAGMPGTRVFTGTGAVQTFTVPANVSSIRVIAVGADGGVRVPKTCGGTGFNGGAGARIEGTYAVTPGQIFTVIPGSPGASGDCESGGGGATGVYIAGSLAIIAGAGGGDDNTGNGGGGQAGLNGSNGGSPAGGHCQAGGVAGTAGAGGGAGEIPPAVVGQTCPSGDGGGGGGGFNSAGQTQGSGGGHTGPTGGGRCNIAGAAGGIAGTDAGGGAAGVNGGWGACGGGGADDRESGGGGGYSGGGGGPESAYPGGGGSIVQSAGAATVSAPTTVAGADGGGTGQVGSVRLCWAGANLSVTKDDAVASVPSGSQTTYTLVVKNAGPSSANGAIVTDPAVPGLNCPTVTCSAAGGAVCPGSPTVSLLQTSGLVIPTLPSGGTITLQLACTVTATGH